MGRLMQVRYRIETFLAAAMMMLMLMLLLLLLRLCFFFFYFLLFLLSPINARFRLCASADENKNVHSSAPPLQEIR